MSRTGDATTAIVGLGLTELGKVYGPSASEFAAQAVERAAADAGMALADIDGLLVSGGTAGGVTPDLQRMLGLRDLRMLAQIEAYGSTAIGMMQYATLAIQSDMASVVACVWADTPLVREQPSAYTRPRPRTGFASIGPASGLIGANPQYALAARRHMDAFGTTDDDFAAVAVAQRAWAVHNPLAQFRQPITVADHHTSRMIADPFRLLDCCLVSNGGIAVIVTAADRAVDLRQPPVHIWGWGQGHPGYPMHRGSAFGLESGARQSGQAAMSMAGVTVEDVDLCEVYDCYTFTVIITLEDYGFCKKGEGGAFASSGALGPGGTLPTNTGGGQLSSYYAWGMTPLSEAVIQVRGDGGERQVDRHEVALVSGNGGILDHHSTLILGKERRQR
ncbi:thiolase family protein [Dactylosporangium sp. AC04546]|uniref:thiolase family protein n=1 Tax=Dactylosporangium sp. AC04546 TaxID=2862460 RepID=UPI001EDF5F8E|nr:thiolase family protein [Dactylosporangium sp. AC04546]WVK86947.1 thiolase family protein [Dactylosporangium sp. AC04546]